MKNLIAKWFRKKKPLPPAPPAAVKPRNNAARVAALANQMMQIQMIPGTAEKVACGAAMVDGICSLRGWRVTITGKDDNWRLLACTDQGEEIALERDGIISLMMMFVDKHAREPVMEMVELARKDVEDRE